MKTQNHKTGLVVGLFPEQYRIADPRLNKPVCHQHIEEGKITGSMLLQDLETASIEGGKEITYFCPNNVAVLLSVSSKSLGKAKELYEKFFHSPSIEFRLEKIDDDKKAFLNRVSTTVCDYIEHVQTSVVFAYTALETFANLSIPEGYLYHTENKSKGIRETYDKDAIERWLSLKVKVQHILREIYGAEKVERQKWWGHFSNLERYRNDIIHFFTQDVVASMKEERYRGRTVTVKVRFIDFKTYTRAKTLHGFTDSESEIRRAAFDCLGRFELKKKVHLIGVRTSNLEKAKTQRTN